MSDFNKEVGKEYSLYFGENNPNNKVITILAIVDDGSQVVFKHFLERKDRWAYEIESLAYFQLLHGQKCIFEVEKENTKAEAEELLKELLRYITYNPKKKGLAFRYTEGITITDMTSKSFEKKLFAFLSDDAKEAVKNLYG